MNMIESNLTFGENTKIKLLTQMVVGIGGDRWPAANKFCELICHNKLRIFYSELFDNKRVIDLGSGTGLTSIVIDKVFKPAEVLVTDQESHMKLIRNNLQINSTNKCIAKTYDWTERSDVGTFDVIVAFEW